MIVTWKPGWVHDKGKRGGRGGRSPLSVIRVFRKKGGGGGDKGSLHPRLTSSSAFAQLVIEEGNGKGGERGGEGIMRSRIRQAH